MRSRCLRGGRAPSSHPNSRTSPSSSSPLSPMRLHGLLSAGALAAAPVAVMAASGSGGGLDINGWYACSETTGQAPPETPPVPFECAEVRVPLCWDGICSSDKTIDLFVRRMLAVDSYGDRKKAVWLLQGGPGLSSAVMDSFMVNLNSTTGGLVDMYTVDHRGTGRSFFLECDAAQAFAATSPSGTEISVDEIVDCFADLSYQIDGQFEAFSVTSTAKDVVYLVEQLHGDDEDVFIYGVSYGTLLTERIMHLAPANVRGYILDGIMPEDSPSFAETNTNRIPVGDRFAQACEADALCSSYFEEELAQYGNLTAAWLELYDKLDNATPGELPCADLLADNGVYPNPSDFLRNTFEVKYIKNAALRTLVPAILYRVSRCDEIDIPFLRTALSLPEQTASSSSSNEYDESSGYSESSDESSESSESSARRLEAFDKVDGLSSMLHWIIKVSELWTNPSPSWDDELAVYHSGVFTAYMIDEFSWYCYMTSNYSTPACSFLLDGSSDTDFDALDAAGPFTYTPDEYFHKFATIPEGASLLMFNGDLDFQTSSEGGLHEFENIVGDQKMLVTFENGVHGTAFQQTTPEDTTHCGAIIVAQFVMETGDLSAVNTSCMGELPAISFNDSYAIESTFPGLTDLYDGEMPVDSAAYAAEDAASERHRRHRAKRYGIEPN